MAPSAVETPLAHLQTVTKKAGFVEKLSAVNHASNSVNIEKMVSQMTTDEKISLLAGKNIWETYPIDRLSIPSLKVSDGPNGARGATFFDGTTAACFPACVSLASTFNPVTAHRIGVALAQETTTKGAYVILGPTVCAHRSPLGGRNFEAFSEDPLLSGLMAAEYVKGVQSERVGATIKHFVANEQETKRFTVKTTVSERALREIYLKPFEIVTKAADPWCIMTSYPVVNGTYTDSCKRLVDDVLRKQWGFTGLVMSDWAATSSTANSICAGLDLEMPGPPKHRTLENVNKAIKEGLVKMEDLDERARMLLRLLERAGKFADRKTTPEEKSVDLPEHRALIREAGAEGIVLLKNANNTLPLDRSKCKKIAIVGPLAKRAAAHGGGSASLNCHYKISPFDALTNRLGGDSDILYSQGAQIFRSYPDLTEGTVNKSGGAGFTAEYYESRDLSGEPFLTAHFPRSAYTTVMDDKAKGAKSVRFSSIFTPSTSGSHYLSFSTMGPGKVSINGHLVAEQKADTNDSMGFFLGVQDETRFQHNFEAGEKYEIVAQTVPPVKSSGELYLMDGCSALHLGFVEQEEMQKDLLAEAVEMAKQADYTIVCVGRTDQWETEGQDMSTMDLPADGSQDALITAVSQVTSTKTIVVVTTGGPVSAPWLGEIDAFLQAWYGGQETGNAIIDVVFGQVNPSGKLPCSWPRKIEDTACFGNFGVETKQSGKVEYVEDINVGYRHFDQYYGQEKEVLFAFGHGLSYTTFDITNIKTSGQISQDGTVTVIATVRNTGSVGGSEVVQVYVTPPSTTKVPRPPKALAGFAKVYLQPGEQNTVQIAFQKNAAAFFDEELDKWAIDAGQYQVLVGTSSRPVDLDVFARLVVKDRIVYGP